MTYTAESAHKESPNEDSSSPPGSGDPFSLAEHGNIQLITFIFETSTFRNKSADCELSEIDLPVQDVHLVHFHSSCSFTYRFVHQNDEED